MKAQLIAGDVWLAQLWNGDTAQARAAEPALEFVLPREGSMIYLDSIVIPARGTAPPGGARIHQLRAAARGRRGDLTEVGLRFAERGGAGR